jgi:hypothetical protein
MPFKCEFFIKAGDRTVTLAVMVILMFKILNLMESIRKARTVPRSVSEKAMKTVFAFSLQTSTC